MNETQILEALEQAMKDAPKSSKGFVNFKRAEGLRMRAASALVDLGIEKKIAIQKTSNITHRYDTYLHKKYI